MKKERISFHALHRSPGTGKYEYMKRKCAQLGASSLTCRSYFEIVPVFLWNSLLALMLNSNAVGGGIGLQTAFCRPHRHSVHRPITLTPHFRAAQDGYIITNSDRLRHRLAQASGIWTKIVLHIPFQIPIKRIAIEVVKKGNLRQTFFVIAFNFKITIDFPVVRFF